MKFNAVTAYANRQEVETTDSSSVWLFGSMYDRKTGVMVAGFIEFPLPLLCIWRTDGTDGKTLLDGKAVPDLRYAEGKEDKVTS